MEASDATFPLVQAPFESEGRSGGCGSEMSTYYHFRESTEDTLSVQSAT